MTDAKAFNDLFKRVSQEPAEAAERILSLENDLGRLTALERLHLQWREDALKEIEALRKDKTYLEGRTMTLQAEVARLKDAVQEKAQ